MTTITFDAERGPSAAAVPERLGPRPALRHAVAIAGRNLKHLVRNPMALVFIAFQMAFSRLDTIWLPKRLHDFAFDNKAFSSVLDRFEPWMRSSDMPRYSGKPAERTVSESMPR